MPGYGARFSAGSYTEDAFGSHTLLASSEHACDQWHSSRVFTSLTDWHHNLRPNTEGDEVDESTHERYLNQTWGAAWVGDVAAAAGGTTVGRSRRDTPYLNEGLKTTANSALGHLLTKGSLLGAGVHGSQPSGTSQWYSVDLGLIHLVGLDLDPLLDSTKGAGAIPLGAEQRTWLEQDLIAAAANRAAVPWIIVTSHFPLHNAAFEVPGVANASAAFYLGDTAEQFATSGHDFIPCLFQAGACQEKTVGELLSSWGSFMDPILLKYKVDVYDAGMWRLLLTLAVLALERYGWRVYG
jgi:hypothetical protein